MPYRPLVAAALLGLAASAHSAPRLVASIPPVHSLVAAVAGDAAAIELLVPAGRSPHAYALKPSDTRALARAEAVFLAGGASERFLDRALSAVAGGARVVRMTEIDGINLLRARAGGVWRGGKDETAQDHAGDDGDTDPHLWLDPRNAIAFTRAVAEVLAEIDPAQAATYRANARARVATLERLHNGLAETLAPVRDRPYMVFHDAYQYFEARYDLAAAGSIAVDPGRPPGAERIAALRQLIRARGAVCVFIEPQFEPAIARTIVDGTGARPGRLDPLGAGLAAGPSLYPRLLRRLADDLTDCLRDSG
jgi:zinc transport system substrate-binding protein